MGLNANFALMWCGGRSRQSIGVDWPSSANHQIFKPQRHDLQQDVLTISLVVDPDLIPTSLSLFRFDFLSSSTFRRTRQTCFSLGMGQTVRCRHRLKKTASLAPSYRCSARSDVGISALLCDQPTTKPSIAVPTCLGRVVWPRRLIAFSLRNVHLCYMRYVRITTEHTLMPLRSVVVCRLSGSRPKNLRNSDNAAEPWTYWGPCTPRAS